MRRALAAVSLAAVLAAAGCGGKGRLGRQEFVSKANSICATYEAQQNAVTFPTVNPVAKKTTHAQRAEWAVALKQIVDLGDAEIRALRKLRPPKELQERYDAVLTEWQRAYDTLREGSVGAKQNDVPTLKKKVPDGRRQLLAVSQKVSVLGLETCA